MAPLHLRAAAGGGSDLWSTVDAVVTYGALATAAGAALLAVFADRRPPERVKEEQSNGFKWGLIGAISCFPLFNWLGWVLAALEDEDRARTYYWFAALYALPLLRSGFDVDPFALAMLVAGAAHAQAERVAATEPDTQASLARALSPLSIVKTLAGGSGRGAFGQPQQRQEAPRTRSEELEEVLRTQEFDEFDRRLREREEARRRRQQQQ